MPSTITNYDGSISTTPQKVVTPTTVEEIQAVLSQPHVFPSPVRAMGSYHSLTPCASSTGTIVDMKSMKKIISIDAQAMTLTAQAGLEMIEANRELRKQNLQFMLNIEIGYPDFEDEVQIVLQTTSNEKPAPRKVMEGPAILRYQELVRRVPVSPFVVSYAVALSQSSRPQGGEAPQFVRDYVEWGAGPRASQYLILGAKARTILQGRYAVSIEDIQALAPSVLRHRVVPNYKAQGEGLSSVDIIKRLLSEVKPPKDGKTAL